MNIKNDSSKKINEEEEEEERGDDVVGEEDIKRAMATTTTTTTPTKTKTTLSVMKSLQRWKDEMPTEGEMRPKDKYTMFDRKERGYRKGIHSELSFFSFFCVCDFRYIYIYIYIYIYAVCCVLVVGLCWPSFGCV